MIQFNEKIWKSQPIGGSVYFNLIFSVTKFLGPNFFGSLQGMVYLVRTQWFHSSLFPSHHQTNMSISIRSIFHVCVQIWSVWNKSFCWSFVNKSTDLFPLIVLFRCFTKIFPILNILLIIKTQINGIHFLNY